MKTNLPTSCQRQQEELLAEGNEVRNKKVFPVRDEQNYKLYPRGVAVKIGKILPNTLAEKVAEKLDLPCEVIATDNLVFRTLIIGWYQVFDGTATLIVEGDSKEATVRLRAWSKDAFFEEKVVNNQTIQLCAPSLINCDFCKSHGLNFQRHDENWCPKKKFNVQK